MSNEREEHVHMAKLAERAERYDEMAFYMRDVAKLNVELTLEERNLLTVAYKNVIGTHRASWRIVSSIEEKEGNAGNEIKVALVKAYREKIQAEISDICTEIIGIVDDYLMANAENSEYKMYCYKLKGDYYRYLAESSTGDARKNAATAAREAYNFATEIAQAELPPTHPARLGLVLNFSVFYYEILNSPDRACHLAKQGFDDAISGFDNLSEEAYKDSTFIMQLLRDNLTLWTTDENYIDKSKELEAEETAEV